MFNPLLKLEMLREGRGARLPLLIIFYNAILALITIVIMLLNAQSFSEGYYYDPAASRTHFLIISTIQIAFAVCLVTVLVWSSYSADNENRAGENFQMVPGFCRQFVFARLKIAMFTSLLTFGSSLPVILLSAIYSGVDWLHIMGLFLMVVLFCFWSGALAILCFSMLKKSFLSMLMNIVLAGAFSMGTYLMVAVINGRLFLDQSDFLAGGAVNAVASARQIVSMIILSLSPLSAYMGFRSSITGESGFSGEYSMNLGLDLTSPMFEFVFFKLAIVMMIFSGLLFIWLSVRLMNNRKS